MYGGKLQRRYGDKNQENRPEKFNVSVLSPFSCTLDVRWVSRLVFSHDNKWLMEKESFPNRKERKAASYPFFFALFLWLICVGTVCFQRLINSACLVGGCSAIKLSLYWICKVGMCWLVFLVRSKVFPKPFICFFYLAVRKGPKDLVSLFIERVKTGNFSITSYFMRSHLLKAKWFKKQKLNIYMF